MKILQINSVCGNGSTGRIATDLYGVLNKKGHDCLISYGRGKAPHNINAYRIGTDIDVNLHVIGTRIFDRTGFYSRKSTNCFIRKIEQYSPDVIHLHNLHGYYINIELLFDFLKAYNTPVVWTIHDCWAFTGHCSYFSYVGCEKWKTGCYNCPNKKEYPSSFCMDNSKWNYDMKRKLFTSVKNMTIVTPSKWLAGLVAQSFLRKSRIVVINNGIDLDIFKPSPGDFRKKHNLVDKYVVLGVADGWDQRKGLSDIIELSKMLDSRYRIVLVGISPKESKKLSKNIFCIPRTNNIKELAEIYTAADVFVNPSREETMGLVSVEALACGTPAIVYNVTACAEGIDEKCGVVVELSAGVEGIFKAIQKIRDYSQKNLNVLDRAKRYNKEDRFSDYIKIYSEVIDRSKKKDIEDSFSNTSN